jgi:hypothetical protein
LAIPRKQNKDSAFVVGIFHLQNKPLCWFYPCQPSPKPECCGIYTKPIKTISQNCFMRTKIFCGLEIFEPLVNS